MTRAPVLRWPGAKWRIADWVVGHLPQHDAYVEPFFGSGAVLFGKDVARVEIVNDLDDHVVTCFRVVREQAGELSTLLALTPWSEAEYRACWRALRRGGLSDLEHARCLIVCSWQQMSSKPVSQRSNWRLRETRGQSPITAWHTLPDRVRYAAERLAGVQIAQKPAVTLIEQVRGPEVLLYVDPPYLREIRGAARMYDHEMRSREQHAELLDTLRAHTGPVVLSAYANDWYGEQLPGWHTVSTGARTQTNAQRAETLWLNPVAWRRLTHVSADLFAPIERTL